MSQPDVPRKFKFVGGPSRKRRQCAASAPREAKRSARGPTPVSSSNDEAADTTVQGATFCADATHAVLATVQTPSTDVLESLLGWPPSTELLMGTDAGVSTISFNDPVSQSGASFHLATSSHLCFDSGAALNSTLDKSGEYLPGDQCPPGTEEIPSEGSSSSIEDIWREIGPELENSDSIPINTADTFGRLFSQYDREYCVWPLTNDFEANPFRYDLETGLETGRSSPLLWHSILALSYKHIHRETRTCFAEAKVHKQKATQLLKDLESYLETTNSKTNLLNGLLILMTLDCATSALGPWVAHLGRAQKIMESSGLLTIQKTPKIQAQVDMLVWWDVTLGLTTRQGYVLSDSTISSAFSPDRASTFYNISGCPEELFEHMFRLGTYAHELELVSHMTCATFDMGPVLGVEKAIAEWRAPQYNDPDIDFAQPGASGLPDDWGLGSLQSAHYIQDLYHCAQAWRFSLLVYIDRVFKWRRGEASMARIKFFARKALNNVFSCRRSVMIQKQLLLPVFLSACETDDEHLREEARGYCSWWGRKTRYDMFITTLSLLEEVWSAASDPDSWWGSLIDQKSGAGSTRQYLFG